MLPSSKALIPPRLNSVICQGNFLQCDQLLCTTEDSLALRGTLPVALSKLGCTISLSAKVSLPRVVLRSSSTSIGPYKSSESTILRCSHIKGHKRKIRRDGAQFTEGAPRAPDL